MLSEIPREIAGLKKLREVVLRRHAIRNLPVELFDCALLRVLDLGYNRIGYLPDDVGRLSNLSVLRLDHNRYALNHRHQVRVQGSGFRV